MFKNSLNSVKQTTTEAFLAGIITFSMYQLGKLAKDLVVEGYVTARDRSNSK